jgi:hypothetical protein
MGATEEQMQLIFDVGITDVSYVLILYSFAFLIFLFTSILLHLYAVNMTPVVISKDVNRHTEATDSRQIRDADEFELEGLMSDNEH